MLSQYIRILALTVIGLSAACGPACAQDGAFPHVPSLDVTLMAFKEQGAWYFLCEAPQFQCRTPHHYSSFGPPPPHCPPPAVCAAPGCAAGPMVAPAFAGQ
ncbi:MAG: hypothetical protein AB1646_16030 [Thermodesulfobacteriota bacterium]